MAIDPRLPLPIEERNKPLEGDWMRMRRRLDELLRKLMQPMLIQSNSVIIADTATTATTTLAAPATYVALCGLDNQLVGVPLGVDCIARLTISGSTVTATRAGTQGDLVITFIAFNP